MTEVTPHTFLDGSHLLIQTLKTLKSIEQELSLAPGQEEQLKQIKGQIQMVEFSLDRDRNHRIVSSDLEGLSLRATTASPDAYIRELLRAKGKVHGIYIHEASQRLRKLLGDNLTPEIEQVLIGMTTRTLVCDAAVVDCIRAFNLASGALSPRLHDLLNDPIQNMTKIAFGYMPELEAIDQFSPEEGWTYNQVIPLHGVDSVDVKLYEVVIAGNKVVNIAVANGTWIEKTVDEHGQVAIGIEMNHEVPLYVSNELRAITPATVACWRPASDQDINDGKYQKAFEFQTARMQEFTIHLEKSKQAEAQMKEEASPLILPEGVR